MSSSVQSPLGSRSQRKRLGELAVETGMVSKDAVKDALSAQKELKKLGFVEKLGRIFIKKKLISDDGLNQLLRLQGGKVQKLGSYEIIEKVGQGAMGAVFKARQVSMDRIVALKILSPAYANDPKFIKRFTREARAAGQFSHEHIVTALDVGFAKPYHYLVMDYVEGRTLLSILKERGPLPEMEALEYTLHVALALQHALGKKVIHRDVKPDNIMITKQRKAKLLDLGLACIVDVQAGNEEKESEGAKRSTGVKAVGTPHYISPEAASGKRDIDTRTDIYSLGCTLYHMLTGSTPFSGRGRQVMAAHLTETIPDPREKRPDCSEAVARVVAKMTAKDRDHRYADPTALLGDLRACLDGKEPPAATPSGKSGRAPRAMTTGPRAPIGARGTTGPRIAVRPHGTTGPRVAIPPQGTTGPAAAIQGRGSRRLSLNQPTGTAGGKPGRSASSALGVAACAVIALLGIGWMALWSGPGETGRAAKRATPGASGGAKKEAPGTLVTDSVSKALSGRQRITPKPKHATPEPAFDLEQLKQELKTALEHEEREPDAFHALLPSFRGLARRAESSPLSEEVNERLRLIEKRWNDRFEKEWEGRIANAQARVKSGRFSEALQAASFEDMPPNLKTSDARERMDAGRKRILEAIRTEAGVLFKKAEERAGQSRAEDLEWAQAQLKKLDGLPSELEDVSRQAQLEIAKHTKALLAIQKREALRKQEVALERRRKFKTLRKEVEALCRAGKFAKAHALLTEKMASREWASVKTLIEAELADLDCITRLQKTAVDVLRTQSGKRIRLKRGKTSWEGTVTRADPEAGIDLKLSGGASITLRVEQLDPIDVERFAATGQQQPPKDVLKGLGLLFLCAGDFVKARKYFTEAGAAGMGEAVHPYLKRVEILELGEKEVQARDAWAKTLLAASGKEPKLAVSALESFEAEFGTTQFAREKAQEFAALLKKAKQQLLFGQLPTKGLQMWMGFNEGKGDRVSGSKDGSVVGELRGGPAWTKGKSGSALQFDGQDDFVEVRLDVSEKAFTAAMWFKTDNPNCGIFCVTVGTGARRGGHDRHVYLSGGEAKTRVWSGSVLQATGVQLADGKWHHVVLQYGPGIKGDKIFVDGVERAAGRKTKSDFNWQTTVRIGYSMDARARYFKGVIDEVLIYDRALTPEEIARLGSVKE